MLLYGAFQLEHIFKTPLNHLDIILPALKQANWNQFMYLALQVPTTLL